MGSVTKEQLRHPHCQALPAPGGWSRGVSIRNLVSVSLRRPSRRHFWGVVRGASLHG